jgi:hypothetical protein
MRHAIAGLAVALALGATLAVARAGGAFTAYGELAALHPLWGLYGWMALLVMGVAYQVVPMFQLTPNYPRTLTAALTGTLFGLLALRRAASFLPAAPASALTLASDALLAAGIALFALVTLRLQNARKRKVSDTTLLFWRIGMAQALLCAALWLALPWLAPENGERARLLLGIAALPGAIVAVINGMLYKIVPFLAWFHLQARYAGRGVVPNMKQLQPDRAARGQMKLYLAAWSLLAAAPWLPWLARPSALLWAANAVWLGYNLVRAARLYQRTERIAQDMNRT